MFKFFIDTQTAPRLARYLKSKGFDSIHAMHYEEDGHLMKDKKIIEIAVNEDWVIITKDSDFLDNFYLNGSPPRIIYLKIGNITNNELLDLFENNFENLIKLLVDGCDLITFDKEKLVGY
jgi:predicted nuclease of predicted toxin-antitoxin system